MMKISFFIKSAVAACLLLLLLAVAVIPPAYAQITQPSPDLNIRFDAISQTPTVLGETNPQGRVDVLVTNTGTAAYQGPLNLNIYASPDGVLDNSPLDTPKTLTPLGGSSIIGFTSNDPLQGTNELLGTIRLQNVNLTPNQSQTVTVDFTSSGLRHPSVVAPGAYYLIAQVDTTNKVASQLVNRGDSVIVWDATLLNVILESGISRGDSNNPLNLGRGTAPPLAARDQAIVHAAIYDAVNAIDQINVPYAVHIDPSDPRVADASVEAAVAEAGYTTLVSLFSDPNRFDPNDPNQAALRAILDQQLSKSLEQIPDGTAKDNGISIGQDVANQILESRRNDGVDQAQIPYTAGNNPGEWRPTFPDFPTALLPGWGSVTPFSPGVPPRDPNNPIARLQQFNLSGPPAFNSQEYVDQENFIRQIGSFQNTGVTKNTRTADQTQSALFWSLDRPNSFRPPGQWNEFAQQLALQKGNTLDQNALLFAQINIAEADAGILTWDSKYTYNQLRPIQAIRQDDPLDQSATVRDPDWLPLLAYTNPVKFSNTPITPPFPDYNSGHAAFGGAAGQVLINFFGDNTPFSAPSQDYPGVARYFSTISAAIEDNAASRIYGGVHVPSSAVTQTSTLPPAGKPGTPNNLAIADENENPRPVTLDLSKDPDIKFGRNIGNNATGMVGF